MVALHWVEYMHMRQHYYTSNNKTAAFVERHTGIYCVIADLIYL